MIVLVLALLAVLPGGVALPPCAGDLCGFANPEDLAALPGTHLIIVSQQSAEDPRKGLLVLDPHNGMRTAIPNPIADAQCTGGRGGGIGVRREGGGYRLLRIVYGATDIDETWRFTVDGITPRAVRVGCIPAPAAPFVNDIAPLPGGGLSQSICSIARCRGRRAMRGNAWRLGSALVADARVGQGPKQRRRGSKRYRCFAPRALNRVCRKLRPPHRSPARRRDRPDQHRAADAARHRHSARRRTVLRRRRDGRANGEHAQLRCAQACGLLFPCDGCRCRLCGWQHEDARAIGWPEYAWLLRWAGCG